jgi:hypothetical protein
MGSSTVAEPLGERGSRCLASIPTHASASHARSGLRGDSFGGLFRGPPTEPAVPLLLQVAEPLSILVDADLAARVALRKDRARVWRRLAVRAPRAAPGSPEEEAKEQMNSSSQKSGTSGQNQNQP